MLPDDDVDGELGTFDVVAMDGIRSAFTDLDGLIETAGFRNLADPELVRIRFSDGIGDATACQFDIRWYRKGYYSIHHTDSIDRNFRWDYHPKADAPDKHFHPPPDTPSDDPKPSCLTVEQPPVVTRTVHKLWRRAYDTEDTAKLNVAEGDL